VRVRRRSVQPWRSPDVEREVGTRLLDASRGVDLDRPEVTVAVEAYADATYLVIDAVDGAGGVPLGTQDRVLSLLSGGFDSPVATWMLMRRGAPAEFLHVQLECAQADHALAVAHQLWSRWGAGTLPVAWMVDFTHVRHALLNAVDSRLRQVVLKQLMLTAADAVAARAGIPALVTGESVGQVSSQTLRHLAAIDAACNRTVLRPLSGMDKEEIIALSRRVGTHDLSARAKEVCDLSVGPVAVGAPVEEIDAARAGVPAELVEAAVAARQVVALDSWVPGMPAVPVVDRPPDGVPLVTGENGMPPEGPIALAGRRAVPLATRLRATGRDVWLVQSPDRREAQTATS
jgi:tRNA uracil 4-sulfurtransferase